MHSLGTSVFHQISWRRWLARQRSGLPSQPTDKLKKMSGLFIVLFFYILTFKISGYHELQNIIPCIDNACSSYQFVIDISVWFCCFVMVPEDKMIQRNTGVHNMDNSACSCWVMTHVHLTSKAASQYKM